MDKDNRNYVPLIAILGGILAAIIVLAWIFVPKVMNAYTSLPIWSWEAFTLFGLWPGFKTLVQWVIPIAAVTLIIVGKKTGDMAALSPQQAAGEADRPPRLALENIFSVDKYDDKLAAKPQR